MSAPITIRESPLGIVKIDGIPVPVCVYNAAVDRAKESGHGQLIGARYDGPRGPLFFRAMHTGDQCQWIAGFDREALIDFFHCFGIIHVSPHSERIG